MGTLFLRKVQPECRVKQALVVLAYEYGVSGDFMTFLPLFSGHLKFCKNVTKHQNFRMREREEKKVREVVSLCITFRVAFSKNRVFLHRSSLQAAYSVPCEIAMSESWHVAGNRRTAFLFELIKLLRSSNMM